MPTKQLKSWSFSRYADYCQCPLKTKLKHLDKIAEPPNEAMSRGTRIHDQARDYIKGETRRLPTDLKKYMALFKTLRKKYKLGDAFVEEDWSFTRDWTKTRWDDWTGCAVRIKLDVAYFDAGRLHIVDWKTGKFRIEESRIAYTEQLELYALAALLLYPDIETVAPRLVYLDAGIEHPDPPVVYAQEDVPRLKKQWAKQTRAMLNDKRFAPRPNDKCQWCFYRASNKEAGGGQCKY